MKSRVEIEQELSIEIANTLESTIQEKGEASLLVSGGSTPIQLFKELSKQEINWNKVTISLVDERLVDTSHKDSNTRLVQENLLQNKAKQAHFVPLVFGLDKNITLEKATEAIAKIKRPFTIVVLGMGADGHTASLFPNAPQLEVGMSLQTKDDLILTEPPVAPYDRISFTRTALLNTDRLFLHCYGEEKKAILKQVEDQKGESKYPIAGFIHQDKVKLDIYWAN